MSRNGMKDISKVTEGISNSVLNSFNLLDEDKQDIIAERYETCLNCPFNSEKAASSKEYKDLTGKHYKTERTELHCSLCGCVAKFKVAALSSNCGAELWNAQHPQNPELHVPLKWKSIDSTESTESTNQK